MYRPAMLAKVILFFDSMFPCRTCPMNPLFLWFDAEVKKRDTSFHGSFELCLFVADGEFCDGFCGKDARSADLISS